MHIILNDYQWDFLTCTARYPGFSGGWGTGKTLNGIQKAVILSQAYRDNLGIIVRKTYKDLRDSTVQDFQLYTGLKVPETTRDVVFETSNSKVMFRHMEELTSGVTKKLMQNINLGWGYIEQAEEFDTEEPFTMLRGRLRRKLRINQLYFDSVDLRFKYFREADRCINAELPKTHLNYCCGTSLVSGDELRAIMEKKGDPNVSRCESFVMCLDCGQMWSREPDPRFVAFLNYIKATELRQVYAIFNANGKNWCWKRWVDPKRSDPERFPCIQADSFKNAHNLPSDTIDDWKSLARGTETEQRKYRKYVLNCHDEMDVEGAYYGKLMNEVRTAGRIGQGIGFDPDRSAATHTAWDLGINDSTAIWFWQRIGDERRIIHYYENNGQPLEHYIRYLDDVKRRLGLVYGQHFWPHDGRKRDLATGKELRQTAADMGLAVTQMPRENRIEGGIERVRKLLPYCKFHEVECSSGIDALEHYQRRKNASLSTEEKPVFSDTPLHDWASNGADAFRYVSAADRRLGGGMSIEQIRSLQRRYT